MPVLATNEKDLPLVFETMRNFAGGQDSFSDPIDLAQNQCQKMVNMIVRDRFKARTRPGADALPAASTYVSANVTTIVAPGFVAGVTSIVVTSAAGIAVGDSVTGTGIATGTVVVTISGAPTLELSLATTLPSDGNYSFGHAIDGLIYFDTPAIEYLVAVSGGKVWTWPNSGAWAVAAGWNPVAGARVAAAQGVDRVLFSDGIGTLQQWDGTTFTDLLDTGISPPKGATIVLSHAGRMWATGVASAPDTVYASALLAFGVGDWNRTEWSFRVGMGEGDPIMAAASMQQFVMVVLKRSSIWRALTDPQEIPANYSADQPSDFISDSIGCVGRDAWCKYGNDLFFLSDDGIYTVQRMEAAKEQWQLGAAISLPVQAFIDRINPNYSFLAAAKRYREFIFFSAPTGISSWNNETAVYNARLKSWMGIFTNWTPAVWEKTVFGGVKRLVFGDRLGMVNRWKDLEDPQDSDTYLDNGVDKPTKAWTRSMVFGDLESPKTGFNVIVRFNFGTATITFTGVGSDSDMRTWSRQLEPDGSILGGPDTLGETFTLASSRPSVARASLRGLPSFEEFFLKIESEAGFWEVRNLTVGARLRPLKIK